MPNNVGQNEEEKIRRGRLFNVVSLQREDKFGWNSSGFERVFFPLLKRKKRKNNFFKIQNIHFIESDIVICVILFILNILGTFPIGRNLLNFF